MSWHISSTSVGVDVRLVRGVVQHYPWGHPVAIPRLLGLEPDGRPWAELWFGTHLGGPSRLVEVADNIVDRPHSAADDTHGMSTPLVSVSGELPFLVKFLAAAEPLSLQSHPSQQQAQAGYARENRLGVPVSNSRRIYRDPFAKPELVCALGRFEALCGFREPTHTVDLLHKIGGSASNLATMLADHDLDHTVRQIFTHRDEYLPILHDTIAACRDHPSPSAQWVVRLGEKYPDDVSVLVTLLLNHVVLEPGQALYLGPGNLHAYLSGMGIEVMGSSDNVVRCGLTNKHVDVNELLATVVAEPLVDPVVRAEPVTRTGAGKLWKFPTPDAPFALYVHRIDGPETIRARARELTVCGIGSTDRLQQGEVACLMPGEELTLTPSPAGSTVTLFRITEA